MISYNPLTIYIARNRKMAKTLLANSVLVCPSKDKWDDFGFNTLFEYAVIGIEGSISWRQFRFSFLGCDKNPSEIIDSHLTSRNAEIMTASEFPQFYSMLFDKESYSNLLNEFGKNTSREILLSLNDLVIRRMELPLLPWVNSATKTDIFNFSFMRSTATFDAFFNAHLLFDEHAKDTHRRTPNFLNYSFQSPGFINKHSFQFKFSETSIVPKRIAILIGKNGVGKSRALNSLCHSILNGSNELSNEKGDRHSFTRLIAVCTPGETETTFPDSRNIGKKIEYIRLSARPEASLSSGEETLPIVLQQLARIKDVELSDFRWSLFRKSVNEIFDENGSFDFDNLLIIPPINLMDKRAALLNSTDDFSFVRLSELSSNGELRRLEAAKKLDKTGLLVRQIGKKIYPLSSGQLSFIRLAAQLCLHIKLGSIVLIDEPETHLHPQLLSKLIFILNRILESTQSISIIATHSAYLVREVVSGQVHVITTNSEGKVVVSHPRLKTFGADVGAISDFVFEDDVVNNLIDEVKAKINYCSGDKLNQIQQLEPDLSAEAVMYLRREFSNRT